VLPKRHLTSPPDALVVREAWSKLQYIQVGGCTMKLLWAASYRPKRHPSVPRSNPYGPL
jgi:hypothetical protein